MRTAGLALALTLIGCTSPTVVVPSPSPTATATPTASPAASPTASARALRPFTGVLPVSLPDPATIAPDRGRVAYVNATGQLVVQDIPGQARVVHTPSDGFELRLHPHGLRGDTLVFAESRTQGQRTDTRIRRADLAADPIAVTVLDDHSGPFLGSGDTWHPLPPVTNGRDAAWIRVDDERTPFGVHIVLSRAGGPRTVLSSDTSASWVDLHDDGRVLLSVLIGEGQVAQLVLWRDGARTPLGTRPSGEGGPARFVGQKAFWQRGTGIVARSEGGDLIEPGGQVRAVEFAGCGASGTVARYLLIHCGTGADTVLLDPESGERYGLPGVGHVAGSRAVVWREGDQWWLGTIAP